MGKVAPVVVHRRSFASALVLGFFGTLCVVIICGASIAIYGMTMVNDKLDELIAMSPEALTAVASWQEALPPAVADALHDRRMPEYRGQVEINTELVRDWRSERQIPVVEVTNNGDQVISLMSLRLLIQDDASVPIEELTIYAATPIALESEWRGPLLPGSTRRFKAGHIRSDILEDLVVSTEICELRVWDPAAPNSLLPQNRTTLASNGEDHLEGTAIADGWEGSAKEAPAETDETKTKQVNEAADGPAESETVGETTTDTAQAEG
jgi:hypothetical protein